MDKFLMDWHQHDSNKVDEKKLKHRRKGARRYIYTYLYAYVNSNFGFCCFFLSFFMYSNIVYYLIWYYTLYTFDNCVFCLVTKEWVLIQEIWLWLERDSTSTWSARIFPFKILNLDVETLTGQPFRSDHFGLLNSFVLVRPNFVALRIILKMQPCWKLKSILSFFNLWRTFFWLMNLLLFLNLKHWICKCSDDWYRGELILWHNVRSRLMSLIHIIYLVGSAFTNLILNQPLSLDVFFSLSEQISCTTGRNPGSGFLRASQMWCVYFFWLKATFRWKPKMKFPFAVLLLWD